jgi:preprotein translocase subunit Sec63
MLCAARLLSGPHARYSLNESYEMTLSCYELLIDMLESSAAAGELSAFTHLPASEIQTSAETIIDRLLFNREDNPYLALGLERHAPATEVTRRWKRLITLYHPDKYPNQSKYEERAKKINQAYAEVRRLKERDARDEILYKVKKYHLSKNNRIYYSRRMRRLPVVIVTAAIIIAIISMLLFIGKIVTRHSVARPDREVKISMSGVQYVTSAGIPSPR